MESNKLGGYNKLIVVVSILVPVVVAVLFTVRIPDVKPLTFLPPIYAGINALTAILLIVSVQLIKNKKKKLHALLMNLYWTIVALFGHVYCLSHDK